MESSDPWDPQPFNPRVKRLLIIGALIAGLVFLGNLTGNRSSPPLDRDATCSRFDDVLADFRMSDEETADALRRLSAATGDPPMRNQLIRLAEAHERHDETIPLDRVNALCRG